MDRKGCQLTGLARKHPATAVVGGTSVLHDVYLVGWEMRSQVTTVKRWDGWFKGRGLERGTERREGSF